MKDSPRASDVHSTLRVKFTRPAFDLTGSASRSPKTIERAWRFAHFNGRVPRAIATLATPGRARHGTDHDGEP